MNVTLMDRTATPVVYLRRTGPYDDGLPRFWMQTVYPWLAENGLLDRPRYGISHDDPGITDPRQCRYDACAEAPAGFQPSRGTLTTILPGGRYAVLKYAGDLAHIGGAWNALLRDWLPASGLQLDARPCFEHYPHASGFDSRTGMITCEICIPVAPL